MSKRIVDLRGSLPRLERWTVPDLREFARAHDVHIPARAKRAEIMDKLHSELEKWTIEELRNLCARYGVLTYGASTRAEIEKIIYCRFQIN